MFLLNGLMAYEVHNGSSSTKKKKKKFIMDDWENNSALALHFLFQA